jgi:hypothetical protein
MVAMPVPVPVSVSGLARQRGRDKALISRQVAALVAGGKLKTFAGARGAKLFYAAEFDQARADIADPIKEQAAATARLFRGEERASAIAAPPAHIEASEPTLSDAQRQKIFYEAELKKLDLAERRGLVVPIAGVIDALRQAGDAAVQLIDRLPLRAADMTEAVGKDGESGARALFKAIAFELRNSLATAFAKLEVDGKAEEAKGPLVADLPDDNANSGIRQQTHLC